MKESFFISINKDKWKGYETTKAEDPDSLAEHFIDISNDLSYARTFFPTSEIIPYLNHLASNFYQDIYKNKKESKSRLLTFFKYEIPLIMAEQRKTLLYSFLFFLAFSFIGVISAAHDPKFVNLILGENYVNMTNENIAKGDPFHVYKDSGPVVMFVMIASNNIIVAFKMFTSGILMGLGTIFSLLYNGIMIGAFQYYFFSRGLGWQSVLVIWCHGTLEMSAFVISGCAGLTLGNSLLFPKTYSRLISVRAGAKKGLKMMIGLIPVFLTAAFFESFVTRHDHMPKLISISILVLSLTFILWYFVFYPLQLSKRTDLSFYKPKL